MNVRPNDEQLCVTASSEHELSVRERHELAVRLVRSAPAHPLRRPPPPAPPPVHFPASAALGDLSSDALRRLIDEIGCVHIPSLLAEEVAGDLSRSIDRAFDAFDALYVDGPDRGPGGPWCDPYIPDRGSVHATRGWMCQGGGMFTADSQLLCERWLRLLRTVGLVDLVAQLFGEEPVTSLDKCTLRRVNAGEGIEWHQDGSFLGRDSGALNVWISLSSTATAPGLEIVGRRFTDLVETGTGGASYDWSTGPQVVDTLAKTTPIARPEFRPGDALIFDGLLLHRTAQEPPEMPDVRHAIETWFFRASHFPPHQQIPLAF